MKFIVPLFVGVLFLTGCALFATPEERPPQPPPEPYLILPLSSTWSLMYVPPILSDESGRYYWMTEAFILPAPAPPRQQQVITREPLHLSWPDPEESAEKGNAVAPQ